MSWLKAQRTSWASTALAALCASLLLPMPARAADRALLVGVADYPGLPRRLWLYGPINDVALMRKTLVARGMQASDIRVLVSRAGPSDEPTRANILLAMEQLKRHAQPGDRVVFYLSGHGSQQPQPVQRAGRPLEPDGLDEVFLPADVDKWDGNGARAFIPNALLDDEIGEWIDAMVDKGATVWGVFDTCHAAGMARAGSARWRAVSGAELGLPAPRAASPALRQVHGRTDGRVLAFAAGAHELTGEEWVRHSDRPGDLSVNGVFTFHLAQALAAAARINTQVLGAAVNQAYAKARRLSPRPAFVDLQNIDWP